MDLLLAGCAAGWGIALFFIAGFHATWTIGVTGGPNHGEHPFTVNFVHLIASFWATKGWPTKARWTYIGLVAAGMVLGMCVINLRVDDEPKRCWAARAVMIGLYAGMTWILFWGH